jgi:hypothetical protein
LSYPGGSPATAAKGILKVTVFLGLFEKEKVTNFLDFRFAVGWSKEQEAASLSNCTNRFLLQAYISEQCFAGNKGNGTDIAA